MANERWASDVNFPAGSDPWSGEPTKVAPDAGEIAAGHTPGVKRPAEIENWWKNRTDARLEALEGHGFSFPTKPYLVRDDGDVCDFGIFGDVTFSAGSASIGFAFPLQPGRKFRGIKIWAFGNGAADLGIDFDIAGGLLVRDTENSLSPGNSLDNIPAGPTAGNLYSVTLTGVVLATGDPITPMTEYTVAEGDFLYFTPSPNAAGITIQSVTIVYAP